MSVWSTKTLTCYADQTDDMLAQMEADEARTQQTISNLQKETKETQDAINSLQGQKEQTQSNVNALQNKSATLQSTIDGYSSRLSDISREISETEEKMAAVSAEILRLNTELEEAQAEEAAQYAALKKQMQSTYEYGGSNGILMMLLTSGSIQDFLNRNEYITAIVKYDQKKIAEYRALEKQLEEKKAEMEEKQAEIDRYQEDLDEKHEELSELTDQVMSNLNDTNQNISSEKNKLADYNSQLSSLDSKMKGLESQVAAAQAELAKQIAERQAALIAAGKSESLGGAYSATANELQWLAATIQAEAGGESYTGKLAVGSVILNRVKSANFPNSIVGVITENMQFASYRSGKVELIISNGPNSSCIQAAQEVINGARVGNYLFFMTKKYADMYGISNYTMIGNHAFFYSWVTDSSKKTDSSTTSTTQESTQTQDTQTESTDSESTDDGSQSDGNDSDSGDNSEDINIPDEPAGDNSDGDGGEAPEPLPDIPIDEGG